VPFPIADLPGEIGGHEGVTPAQGWQDVRDYFMRHGPYRYVELAVVRLGGKPHVLWKR
jgi:hypothetical protein